MERNETERTAAERVQEWLPDLRAEYGDHAAIAEALRSLGVGMSTNTLSRIERGTQPPSLEETLALAVLVDGRVDTVLSGLIRIGDLTVRLEARLVDVVDTDHEEGIYAAMMDAREAARWSQEVRLARSLNVPERRVNEAAHALYDLHHMHEEIARRTAERADRDDPAPTPRDKVWQHYRSHAVRTVRAEITAYLKEHPE